MPNDKEIAARLQSAAEAADLSRGRLSGEAAVQLYGRELTMSASRVDRFYACRYLYFLQYGLNAKPRKPAGFDAPTAGTFIHYILENVTRDIKNSGGFGSVSEEQCRALTDKYVDMYIENVLHRFKDKTSRFRYLFNRLVGDALRRARYGGRTEKFDFVPLELEFSDTGIFRRSRSPARG